MSGVILDGADGDASMVVAAVAAGGSGVPIAEASEGVAATPKSNFVGFDYSLIFDYLLIRHLIRTSSKGKACLGANRHFFEAPPKNESPPHFAVQEKAARYRASLFVQLLRERRYRRYNQVNP